jgi:organic hydroperoxide reductase OsmC/OhrA
MSPKSFQYEVDVEWMGNEGDGTASPKFDRSNEISATNKPTIVGSAPVEFGGDGENWSPEELFVAAVSQCHMLTYLFLCARAGIVVESYRDRAVGTLDIEQGPRGRFRQVELHPEIVLVSGDTQQATALHVDAHRSCYIASSIRAEVLVEATVTSSSSASTDRAMDPPSSPPDRTQ